MTKVRALLLALLILGVSSISQLQLNKKVTETATSSMIVEFYVELPTPVPQGKFYVRAEGYSSDLLATPIVTIHMSDQYFDCFQEAPITLCVVDKSFVKEGTTFKIDTYCMTECKFDITAYVDSTYQMAMNENVAFNVENGSAVFEATVNVPKDLQYTEIKVILDLENPEEVNGPLNLFVNAGQNVPRPTQQSFNLKGQDIWGDGKGVFLSKETVKPGDTIKIYVSGQEGMELVLRCFSVSKNMRDISLNQIIYDDVTKNNTKLFVLDLTDEADISQSDVYIKLMKYAGSSRILVSPDSKFVLNKTVQSDIFENVALVTLTPSTRKNLGFENKIWIAVSGDLDSVFSLTSSANNQNYTWLDSEISELSSVKGQEVDNYLFSFVAEADEDFQKNMREFTMGAKVYSGNLEYGVRRCVSLESSGSFDCLLSNVTRVNEERDTFSDITGELSEKNSIKYFTFHYDIRKCTPQGKPLYKCAFQIVCFSKGVTDESVDYMLNFEQKDQQVILQEGIARKDRSFSGHSKQYYFALSQIEDILEVKFYLTVMSGECLLTAATDRRDHHMRDPEVKIAIDDTLSFKNELVAKQYFLKVDSETNSLYSLRAVVKRKTDPNASASLDDRTPIYLSEGIAQLVSISSEQQDYRFYMNLGTAKDFTVQISSQKSIEFEVRQSKKYETQHKPIWKSQNNRADVKGSQSTQFVVIVKGKAAGLISIVYYPMGTCPFYKLGRAVQLDLGELETQCISYHLTKIADLEIVIGNSYFELTTGDLVVSLGQEGNSRQLSGRISILKSYEIANHCYRDPSQKSNLTDCVITLNVTANKDASPVIVAQYIDEELELFDGLQQISKGFLSRGQGRFFYYNVINKKKPIMIALKSLSDVKYRIACRIMDWKQYITANISGDGSSPFPKFEDQNYLHAETIQIGSTAIVIKTQQLSKHEQQNSILLISVLSKSVSQVEADFTIEVIQTLSKLRPAQAKMGYVDQRDARRYEIQTDGTQQIMIHLNSYQVLCAKLQLFTLDGQNISITPQSKSMTGEMLISPANTPQKYIIQVEGLSACSYELSYTAVDQRIYQLIHGHMFNLELKNDDKAYFIYYHNRMDSFRVVSMSQYGQVQFNAKVVNVHEISNISQVIKDINGRFEFGGPSHTASLVVANGSPHFCGNCYYLIEVSSDTPASTIIVLHSVNSPVAIRDNRVIRQTLTSENPEVSYAYMKIVPFKVTIGILFGEVDLSVTNTINSSFSIKQTITQNKAIEVPYDDMSKSNDTIYNNAAFLIKIRCEKSCGYSLVIDSTKFSRRIIQGIPFNIEVASAATGSCVQFLSLEKDTPTHLHISSSNVSNLQYDLKCFSKETWNECVDSYKNGGIIIGEEKNEEILNIELRSIRGYYYMCLTLKDQKYPQNASVLHSENINARYLHINTSHLISVTHNDPEVQLEMYNPSNNSLMIEVFECKGQLSFEANTDYKKFLDSNSSTSQHSKTAGHYVVKLDPNETSSSLVFARVKIKNVRYDPEATFIVRYSEFEPYKYPYSALAAEQTAISYHIDNQKITFVISSVEPNDHYNVMSYQYKLFISSDLKALKSAVQCETGVQIVKVQRVAPNEAVAVRNISFEVDLDEVKAVMPEDSNYFFVGAAALLDVVSASSDAAGSQPYKIIYDSIQLALSKQASRSMATFKTKVKFVFLWVVFPILFASILLYLAVRYCINRVKYLPDSELIETAPAEEDVNYTQGTTVKHLVGTTTNTDERPRMQQN